MVKKLQTGYASIDKPWQQYYSKTAIEAEIPECTLYESIKQRNENYPDNIALDFYGRKITYRSLLSNIESTAASLCALGIKKGDTVAICMLNTPETIYLIYALNMIGAIANMLCPMSPDEELVQNIELCKSNYLFTLDIFQKKILSIINKTNINKVIVANLKSSMSLLTKIAARIIKKVKTIPLVSDEHFISWKAFLAKKDKCQICGSASDTAVILYTGGTTGGSKAVEISNYNIVSVAWQNMHSPLEMKREHVWAEVLPLFIAYGLASGLHTPLMIGMKVLIRLPLTDTLEQLIKMKPNMIFSIPNSWKELAQSNKKRDLSFFLIPASGGDTIPVHIEEQITAYLKKNNSKAPFYNGYGLSEACAQVTCGIPESHKAGTVGIPFAKNVVAAFDLETGEELQYDEEGEICIQTPSMMKGYINNEEETRHVLRKHKDGQIWIHTGDLGFVDSDGYLHINGRMKRFFIRQCDGMIKKIFCPDAENHLLQCKDIEQCIFVQKQAETEQKVCAFIVPSDKTISQSILIDRVKTFCKESLGDFYSPDSLYVIDKFTLTKVGKIDYRALEKKII